MDPRNAVLWTVVAALPIALTAPGASGVAARATGGTIVGVVTTKEPAPKPIRITIDPNVCGQSLPDEAVVVDAAGQLANAVVSVTGVKAPSPPDASVSNEGCRFVPRVGVVRPAGAVKIQSKDPVLHTTHAAQQDGKVLFNVGLPIPNLQLTKAVEKAGVVTLTCSTHTWMRGYLVVSDELSAVSGADGKFRLDGVPAGPHELRVWHESLKAAGPVNVTVKDGETVTVDVTLIK